MLQLRALWLAGLLMSGLAGACGDRPAEAPPAVAVADSAAASADSLAIVQPYRFDAPDAEFRLPGKLKEISGLTYLGDGILGAVQDEEGRLYRLDPETGTLLGEERFRKDGDYEGIERAGDRLFVLRSDGTLYEIEDWQSDDPDDDKIETGLDGGNDTEGLAYDAARNRLLIACKEDPGADLQGVKAIYAFDLATMTLVPEPVYTIPTEEFEAEMPSEGALNDRIRQVMQPAWDLSGFKPAALAMHPLADHLYVLSSVRRAIVVLDATSGEMLAVWPIPDEIYMQPEGLAFLPDGELYIASEGRNSSRGRLFRLTYHPEGID